jgi:hypothetical protein
MVPFVGHLRLLLCKVVGLKSLSPAMYCSGVNVVVRWRWIVDTSDPFFSVLGQLAQHPGQVHFPVPGLEAAFHRGLHSVPELRAADSLEEEIRISPDVLDAGKRDVIHPVLDHDLARGRKLGDPMRE